MRRHALLLSLLGVVACATSEAEEATEPTEQPVMEADLPPPSPGAPLAADPSVAPATEPQPAPPELGFEPSPDDRAAFGATGFLGTTKVVLPDGTEAVGARVADVRPGSGLAAAGVKTEDVLVGMDGTTIRPGDADPIGKLRELLLRHAPDSEATFDVWRKDEGVRTLKVRLGRQPPAFARLETPADWFQSELSNSDLGDLIDEAVALDGGAGRYGDVLARNRKHAEKRDAFRLREVTSAHLNLAANEPLAIQLAGAISRDAANAAELAAGWPPRVGLQQVRMGPNLGESDDVAALVDRIAEAVADLDAAAREALAAWTPEDRAFFAANFEKLTERLNTGEVLYDDEVPARERANRRLVALLSKVDRSAVADLAMRTRAFVAAVAPRLTAAVQAAVKTAGREGLLAAKDTPAGRIEVWGGGNQKHTSRCAFLFDLEGNDNYLDVAGRADFAQPVSIYVDASGDDLWAASAPGGLAAAICGAAVVLDDAGDDQYLSRDWTQGAAVAGFAMLSDRAGRDVYHAQDMSQGIGLAGAGVLDDAGGDDLYTGSRFCQGIGFPGGVGALSDRAGDDRYVCTGRYDSDYGDAGQFSGWGQGVGYGFRGVASGGIGLLLDESGDDVYEAGNFSQGGGYFYAWGILWDAQGRDRYIGSRYAQGFAAHQAVGTFLEGGGDDLYQSHSGVAQGLSWDETSVVFHDLGGNDRYETAGFSLASAAHNGMVLFLDDGGDDVYAALPAHAASNEYHGGRSLALFLDRGGNDVYLGADAKEWNGRAAVRDEGAYHVDLPDPAGRLKDCLR